MWTLKIIQPIVKVVKLTINAHREHATLADPLFPPTGSDKLNQSTGKIMTVRARQRTGSETHNIALQNPTWTTLGSKSGLHDELGM